MSKYKLVDNPVNKHFKMRYRHGWTDADIGEARMSPAPFAKGGNRYAYYLHTSEGLYVVKPYNDEILRHIKHGLKISTEAAIWRDVRTYLTAQYYADLVHRIHKISAKWKMKFVEPVTFRLDGELYFGEKFIKGNFMKWNNNAGALNLTAGATKMSMDEVAGFFSHFTYTQSAGRLMVVDVQGWDLKGEVIFTDPMVHTRAAKGGKNGGFSRDLFAMGNFGVTGMGRFFATHECRSGCKECHFTNPLHG